MLIYSSPTIIFPLSKSAIVSFASKSSNFVFCSLQPAKNIETIIVDKVIFRVLNLNIIQDDDFQYTQEGFYLKDEPRKKFVEQIENRLSTVIHHKRLNRRISYRSLIRMECYNLINFLEGKIKNYEPRIALDGGEDGMDVIKIIIQDSAIALKNGGHLFMEIGYDQADAVKLLLEENEFTGIEIKKDLAGHNRMIHAEKP